MIDESTKKKRIIKNLIIVLVTVAITVPLSFLAGFFGTYIVLERSNEPETEYESTDAYQHYVYNELWQSDLGEKGYVLGERYNTKYHGSEIYYTLKDIAPEAMIYVKRQSALLLEKPSGVYIDPTNEEAVNAMLDSQQPSSIDLVISIGAGNEKEEIYTARIVEESLWNEWKEGYTDAISDSDGGKRTQTLQKRYEQIEQGVLVDDGYLRELYREILVKKFEGSFVDGRAFLVEYDTETWEIAFRLNALVCLCLCQMDGEWYWTYTSRDEFSYYFPVQNEVREHLESLIAKLCDQAREGTLEECEQLQEVWEKYLP